MRTARFGLLLGVAVGAAAATTASAQETERVSIDTFGAEGNALSGGSGLLSITPDQRFVAFASLASNLVSGDNNGVADVFVRDRILVTTERVSLDPAGFDGNGDSGQPSLSADGQLVAFSSVASNLVAGDTNFSSDIFVRDRSTGVTERISVDANGAEANSGSFGPAITPDGRFVAFHSWASNLVAGDTNAVADLFVHDRTTGLTERVSVTSSGKQGDADSYDAAISTDGQVVAFTSWATDLVIGDTNGNVDVFVHDRSSGSTERVSVRSDGKQGNYQSLLPAISADGQVVAFESSATNLVSGDTNLKWDVFIHDRTTGATERVSVDSSGTEGNGDSNFASLSASGQVATFTSKSSNLCAGDTNGVADLFLRNRSTGITERISVDSSGAEENGAGVRSVVAAGGLAVVFTSAASNLVAGDTNGVTDVFVHETCSTVASWNNYGAGFPGTGGVPPFTLRANPVLGTTLTLDLGNSLGAATAGLLFLGFQPTSIHSSWGGDLLVQPVLTIPITIPANGATFSGDIPQDDRMCGTTVDLQALEADPGAVKGVSFTAGLELVLGR